MMFARDQAKGCDTQNVLASGLCSTTKMNRRKTSFEEPTTDVLISASVRQQPQNHYLSRRYWQSPNTAPETQHNSSESKGAKNISHKFLETAVIRKAKLQTSCDVATYLNLGLGEEGCCSKQARTHTRSNKK